MKPNQQPPSPQQQQKENSTPKNSLSQSQTPVMSTSPTFSSPLVQRERQLRDDKSTITHFADDGSHQRFSSSISTVSETYDHSNSMSHELVSFLLSLSSGSRPTNPDNPTAATATSDPHAAVASSLAPSLVPVAETIQNRKRADLLSHFFDPEVLRGADRKRLLSALAPSGLTHILQKCGASEFIVNVIAQRKLNGEWFAQATEAQLSEVCHNNQVHAKTLLKLRNELL